MKFIIAFACIFLVLQALAQQQVTRECGAVTTQGNSTAKWANLTNIIGSPDNIAAFLSMSSK